MTHAQTTTPLPAAGSRAADAATPARRPRWIAACQRQGWTLWHLVGGLALVALAVAAAWPGWCDLAWLAVHDTESSHVILAIPVIAWLVWVRRRRLRLCGPAFSLLGPALVVLGGVIGEVGYRDDVRVFGHIGAVLLVMGAIVAVTGPKVFWRLLPAFAAAAFLIPVPYSVRVPLAMPLQEWTAHIAGAAMNLVGQPVLRTGSVLTINGTRVGVAEACNGMRMVFALVLVCYMFAFSSPLRWPVRMMLIALAPLVALACNVIRVIPVVYLYGHASHATADLVHDLSGWVMIGIAFALMFALVHAMRWLMLPIDRCPLTHPLR